MQNSDLISRSALLVVPNVCKVTEFDEAGFGMSYLAVPLAAINNAPAVDAEPVRHGRWEPVIRYDVFGKPFTAEHTCSICKEEALCCCANYDSEEELSNYCPNCGCKMDAEVSNDA